jgi:hypothetical protein
MERLRSAGKFLLGIWNEDCEDLEPRKLYLMLPDEAAAADGYVRVIDESGRRLPLSSRLFSSNRVAEGC